MAAERGAPVSVVVTCYNQEAFIEEALASVLAQTHAHLIREVIVVDDGSRDRSAAKVREYADRDPRIRLIVQANAGASVARNTGVSAATGDYIAFLDGDDAWQPARLAAQWAVAERLPSVGLLYGDFQHFGARDDVVRARRYSAEDADVVRKLFIAGGPVLTSTTLIRRDCFAAVGGFDPALRVGEDAEMWLRIASRFPIQHAPGVLVRKRVLASSMGALGRTEPAHVAASTAVMLRHFPELRPLRAARETRLNRRIGTFHLAAGNRGAAREALDAVLAANPRDHRTRLLSLLARTPGGARLFRIGLTLRRLSGSGDAS